MTYLMHVQISMHLLLRGRRPPPLSPNSVPKMILWMCWIFKEPSVTSGDFASLLIERCRVNPNFTMMWKKHFWPQLPLTVILCFLKRSIIIFLRVIFGGNPLSNANRVSLWQPMHQKTFSHYKWYITNVSLCPVYLGDSLWLLCPLKRTAWNYD